MLCSRPLYRINKRSLRLAGLGHAYFDLTETFRRRRPWRAQQDHARWRRVATASSASSAPRRLAFEECRSLRLRVGALPQNPTGLMGYAFNWSPEGVVNEYLNDCEVIEGGVRKMVSSMEWHETLYVEGVMLEAFTTSGGLGTICETFHGKVANVDYKTMRYPGHMRLMNFFFHELLMRERRELAARARRSN